MREREREMVDGVKVCVPFVCLSSLPTFLVQDGFGQPVNFYVMTLEWGSVDSFMHDMNACSKCASTSRERSELCVF